MRLWPGVEGCGLKWVSPKHVKYVRTHTHTHTMNLRQRLSVVADFARVFFCDLVLKFVFGYPDIVQLLVPILTDINQ